MVYPTQRLLTNQQVMTEFARLCEIEEDFCRCWKADNRCPHVTELLAHQLPSCKCVRKALRNLPETADIRLLLEEDLAMDMACFFYNFRITP